MKKYILSFLTVALVLFSPLLFFGAFLMYGIWTTNLPPNWGEPFPEGTKIIQHTDTHQGIFRRKGITILVAQIPERHIQTFSNRLWNEEFLSGHLAGKSLELLSTVEAAKDILDSENTMYIFDDGALAFVEEPFSEWEAAIYDLETGLYCCLEYDE